MVMNFTNRPVRLFRRAAAASLFAGLCFLVVKFAAFGLTSSTAIFSDAMETIVNLITAAFAFYSLKVSSRPADECHPYGHGKIEFFSVALEGGAIIFVAGWIIYRAVHDLFSAPHLHQLDLGVWLVATAAVVNAILGGYLIKIGKRENSLVLEADGRHVLTDVFTSAGVVAGLLVVRFTGWTVLHALVAVLVAANIIRTGWKLLKGAAGGMMDASSIEDAAAIRGIFERPQFQNICAHHKLRHRRSGYFHFVDFHLVFPKNTPIEQAHAIATAIEAQVASALGDASVMAHVEPCKNPDCSNCKERKL